MSKKSKSSPTDHAATFAGRLTRLRAAMGPLAIDHLLVTDPTDVGYLTGFLGGDSYLLVGGAKATIISDFRYQEELEEVKGVAEVYIRTKGLVEASAEVVKAQGFSRLGIQGESITIGTRDSLGALLGLERLVTTKGLVGTLRRVKDDSEVALIRKAIRIQEEALEAVLPLVRKRMKKDKETTELDVAAMLEMEMRVRGSTGPSFSTIIAAKANGSLPHYRAGKVKLAKNKPVLIDWGATWRGYRGDMTRTFSIGKWPSVIQEIYGIVLEAHELAAAALAPGKTTLEIDAVARGHIKSKGYGDQFGHGLGHGLGMNGHEDPRLNPLFAPMTLEAGNVVTIEPGIYLPGVGGVRIEDDFLVTENGPVNLCSLPKDLEWSTL